MRTFIFSAVTAAALALAAAATHVEAAAPAANPQYIVQPQGGYYYGPMTYPSPYVYYPSGGYYPAPYYYRPGWSGGGLWIGGRRFGLGLRWR